MQCLSATYTTGSFSMAATWGGCSGYTALVCPHRPGVSYNTTHIKTMSLSTFGLWSIVPGRTLSQPPRILY